MLHFFYSPRGRKFWEILQSQIIFKPKSCLEPHTIPICGCDEFSTDQSTKTLHLQRGIQHFRRCASQQGVHHMGRPQELGTLGGPRGLHGVCGVSETVQNLPLQMRGWVASEAMGRYASFWYPSWGGVGGPNLPFHLTDVDFLPIQVWPYQGRTSREHCANPLYFCTSELLHSPFWSS